MSIEPSAGFLEGREHVLPVRVYYEDTAAGCDTILRACGGERPQSGVRRPLT